MMAEMQAMRIVAVGLAWAGLLGAGPARAGTETFDGTGLSSAWVEAGSFTGQQNVVWSYAHASGTPTVYTNNPSITLQTGFSTNKGWLLSGTITGGCSQVSAAFKQVLSATSDCVVLVNGIQIANYKSSGVLGSTQVAAFAAFDASNRIPFTNEFTLMVSNRLASSGRMAIDDLTWEPFRLFARLSRTGTNPAYAGQEFDVSNEVFHVGQAVSGGWQIPPAFAGTASDTNEPHLTLIPAPADIGKTFELAYEATDAEGTGYAHRASCWMEVLEAPNPRFIDFETASFGYNTNSGVTTNLNGMPWLLINVQTSDATDTRIGTTSARFRHSSSAMPASMESLQTFEGVGAISVHGAYYQSNRVVTVAILTKGEGEDALWVTNDIFSVENHGDITNSVFSVDVQRSEPVYVKLITTGNFDQRANIDDIRVSESGDLPPRLVLNGGTNAPVGWETALEFTLQNAEGILRDWEYSLSPPYANAVFTSDDHGPLQLRFSPVDTNEWGNYVVNVSASITGAVAGATSVTVRVVSPPTFELVPLATNIAVPGIVDIKTTNVVLHGGGTDWDNEWSIAPLFENTPSMNQRNRYRILSGTTPADVGSHTVTAVLTDQGTGVTTTNEVVLVVAGGGGLTNEVYEIVSCSATNVVVNGRTGRVFRVFGTTNLMLAQWSWQGPPVTNADGADVWLDLPTANAERVFFYGVKVSEAP